jgi:hypothetical protein
MKLFAQSHTRVQRAVPALEWHRWLAALVITFSMLGIPPPLIAEFLMLSQHAVRELVRKYQEGGISVVLTRPSNRTKKAGFCAVCLDDARLIARS